MLNTDGKNSTEIKLYKLSKKVRHLAEKGKLEECKRLVCPLMSEYPDYAQPHNLYGVLLEIQKDHIGAMKHFRAAAALDPTYMPARNNLEYFGSFTPRGHMAYDEDDCRGGELL